MLDYDAVFVDVTALDPLIACRWAIVEPDPIPPREAIVSEMSKPDRKEALPMTLNRHASAADGLSVRLTGLRQCLD
jgi:hypothetical protein